MLRKINNSLINVGKKIIFFNSNNKFQYKLIGEQAKSNIDIYADKLLKNEKIENFVTKIVYGKQNFHSMMK